MREELTSLIEDAAIIDEYDRKSLQEAKQRIEVVYNYHYGCAKDKKIVNRLSTIIRKLDFLIGEERRADNGYV